MGQFPSSWSIAFIIFFAKYLIWSWWMFSFSTLMMLFHCILPVAVSKLAVILNTLPFKQSVFLFGYFMIFSFCLCSLLPLWYWFLLIYPVCNTLAFLNLYWCFSTFVKISIITLKIASALFSSFSLYAAAMEYKLNCHLVCIFQTLFFITTSLYFCAALWIFIYIYIWEFTISVFNYSSLLISFIDFLMSFYF